QRLLSINYNTLKSFAFKHINLPKHTITTNLINGVAGNLFPVLLAYYFSPAAAGLLFLAQQLLEAPFGMINKALWRVSYGKLSKETKKPHIAYRTLRKIHSNVSLLYSIPVLVLISFSEYSSIIFGESWKDFALIIPGYCFYVYFKNLSNATSYFTIFHKFTQESVWNIINLTVRILSIIIAANITDDPINCITIYCFISSLVYIGINTYWGLVSLQLGVFWENIAITIIPVLTIAYLISNFTNSLLNKLLLTSIFLVLFLFLSIKRLRKIG
ncbi:MAG: oligosaccharide flippase family protein, partial [Ignavibacteriae bacterium]|nr:oligosaccharide flippase family protein [Ignavibacteriota bacterium]